MMAPLQPWKDREIDLVLDVIENLVALAVHTPHSLPVEDDSCTGTSEGLVHGAGDHVTVLAQDECQLV